MINLTLYPKTNTFDFKGEVITIPNTEKRAVFQIPNSDFNFAIIDKLLSFDQLNKLEIKFDE